MKNIKIIKEKKMPAIYALVIAIALGGTGFFIGKGMAAPSAPSFQPGGFQAKQGSGQMAGGIKRSAVNLVSGEIIKLDEESITIKAGGNGSKVAYISENTVVSRLATSSVDILQLGQQVTISGQEDSSGIISASSIQVRDESGFLTESQR